MKVKPKRTFSWFLEHGMFYLMSVSFIVCFFIIAESVENYYSVNKTVGWQWNFLNWSYVSFNFWIVYLVGFMILFLFKRKTNKFLTKIFYLGSVFLVLQEQIPHFYELFPYLWLYSTLYFIRMTMFGLFFVIFLIAVFKPEKTSITKKF